MPRTVASASTRGDELGHAAHAARHEEASPVLPAIGKERSRVGHGLARSFAVFEQPDAYRAHTC